MGTDNHGASRKEDGTHSSFRKPGEDGVMEGSYAAILKRRTHVLSKIDAETLSHPPIFCTTNNDVLIKIPRDTHTRIKAVWRFSLGYFVIKLDNEDDRKRVSYDGPWKVKFPNGIQQLKIHPWTPMFDPGKDNITRAAIWVRFTALPMEFWDEETIFRLARGLGRPVSVDPRTLRHEYGYFAAALVDIDFSQPLRRILIDGEENDEIFVQEYEILNRPSFCDYCKSIGHKKI
ncbi:uncharacterized protein LOC113312188 [Papaver somniferum]|uniref:uncharacterized protein LOC113312188 n=1 Tax=Papaver somniferum TaxID=3469 RepID=UPI000E6FA512|nr:uncharacterized protein LOC113312188 [Papaver somniferum]